MIDGAVLSAAWIGLWFLLGATFSAGRTSYWLADLAGGAYFTILTAGHRGQTPGMRATGIALKRRDSGSPLGYSKSIIRSVTMIALAAPGAILFIIDCLFSLWQTDRQALHDMAAGTVVVDVRNGVSADPAPQAGATPARSSSPRSDSKNAAANKIETALNTVIGFIRRRSARFWIITGAVIAGAIAIVVGISIVSSIVGSLHSPTKAATSYLEALSAGDVPAMLDNAGIVAPTHVSANTNVLLSAADIQRELRQSANPTAHISNVVVTGSNISTNTATVSMSYVADNQNHDVTASLVKSDTTSSGWAVQITPARLDIDVPTGDDAVTLDGMPLRLDGQVAHVYLFPSIATVATPASVIWKAESTTIDTTNQAPNADPQEVTVLSELTPAASSSARAAVTDQITKCLGAASLAPANCPNTDTPYILQSDTVTNIAWSAVGDPSSGLTVTTDKTGQVTVSGTLKASVSYTDNYPGGAWTFPSSTPETDGPKNWTFVYPLTWNGSGWDLGKVELQTPEWSSRLSIRVSRRPRR